MRRRIVLAGVAAIGLAGCGSNVEPGFVAKQWAGEMRELQINPVFPPREDFQVGDIYLPAVAQTDVDRLRDEKGYLPMSVWLMEAGGAGAAADALEKFYERRSTYPQTTPVVARAIKQPGSQPTPGDPGSETDGNGAGGETDPAGLLHVPQPVLDCSVVDGGTGTGCNIFTDTENTSMRRMRIVGFPTFLSTTITQGNLSAFVPVEAFSAALGLDFGDIEKVSVNVPVAESVGLPAITVLALAETSLRDPTAGVCNSTDTDGNRMLSRIRALLPGGQRIDGKMPASFHAVVVSEVFYTRAIEISIETQESFGLGARLQTLAPSSGGGVPQTAAQSGGQTSSDTAPPGQVPQQPGAVPGAIETLNRLKQATSNLPSAPGGSLQVVSVSDGNVGMRRLFDRPIAIGYRGLSLEVDTQTCQVIGGTSADTPLPKNTETPDR